MSWERTKIDPLEWVQDNNNKFEEEMSDELGFDFLDVGNFDTDEIL
jgi:hypothetical protein